MRDLEHQLTETLATRAGDVARRPPMDDTLRRVRTRRAFTAGLASVVVLAVAAGAVTLAQVLPNEDGEGLFPREQVITSEGPYGFTSREGDYPTIASGEFRGATWKLTGKKVTERGIDSIDLELSITKGDAVITKQLEVVAADDVLMMRRAASSDVLGGADAVFGATTPGVDTVAVEVADGRRTSVAAHLFTDYDSNSTITANYYVAFVPAKPPGFVLARDELGTDLDRETYGRVSLAPHVVASGKQGAVLWSLLFAGMQDRACFVFSTEEQGSECFSRNRIAGAGPLLPIVFERPGVRGVVAVISDKVASVRLFIAGRAPLELPIFEPDRADRRSWPLRMVAVGLEPGARGRLVALNGAQKVMARERF
ncbi:MAG: hypothetical protein ACRDI3_04745 [Actinomycetota bacterium]